MRYQPEHANADLIPDKTWCDAVIVEAIDTTSKQGNQMIAADFQIYDAMGIQPIIRHYFVDKKPGMFKKLCAAIDLDFSSGNIPAQSLKSKKVKVMVRIREDDTGEFPNKNVLAAFAKEIPGANQRDAFMKDPVHAPLPTSEPEDDLPF